METQRFDLIIIGAGINGAAIARESTLEGMDVCLIEQFDKPARGTSSKSSKLIHGGLRYLESFEINLVYECLSDRRRLLELYPELVRLENFYIPIYKNTSRASFIVRIGLLLYAILGGGMAANRFSSIPRSRWSELDGLNTRDLKHVYKYYDAQTDDAELTTVILNEAIEEGARVLFNAEFKECLVTKSGVTVTCQQGQDTVTLQAKYLVNAGGPWVNHVLQRCQPAVNHIEIDLVQGTHIELPGRLAQGIYYLEAPQDRRAVFAMPWKDHIMVGTTESLYQGDPADVAPTQAEIDYLLTVYNHYFSNHGTSVTSSDVTDSWAGLRVLPRSESSVFSRSRETIFHKDDEKHPRIFSIYGGKLTSHYSTARKLLKLLKRYNDGA
jgi:glycerol-3-phosphate dehydrogenase